MKNLERTMKLGAAMICLFLSVSAFAQRPTSVAKFTIENASDWTIEYIYFSPTWDDYWGDDHLGEYVLSPGYELEMRLESGCGDYDVKVIDEDGDECIMMDVYLCNDRWYIDNEELLDCIYGD